VNKTLKKRNKKPHNLGEALFFLKKEEMEKVVKSYDIVGSIAIMDIPEELEKKEKLIGEAVIKTFNNIKTVLKKSGMHYGKYRTQQLDFVAGENTKETIHTENGVKIKLNVEQVYYSVRLGSERLRVANKIKEEDVLVMFSGCAPFCLAIEKHSETKKVIGIEWNTIAHKYGLENLKLNKSKIIDLVNADVKKVKIKDQFDTVLMPAPKDADTYIEQAINFVKPKGRIFIYLFRHEHDVDATRDELKKKIAWHGRKCELPEAIKCGDFSPGVHRYCFEIELK
jgi:tRNA (guanine37-N1)-methyltransferase